MRNLVDVSVSPRDINAATLAEVKGNLDISDSSEDTYIARLIRAASEAVAQYFDRDYRRSTLIERLPGWGGTDLLLSRWPVESISSLTSGIATATTVLASTYSIHGRRRDTVYRPTGFIASAEPWTPFNSSSAGPQRDYTCTYKAGWLMPGEVADWAAATAYTSSDDWTRSTSFAQVLRFECTTSGTSDATIPAEFLTASDGDTITDGTVVWTARTATEIPDDVHEAVIVTVSHWFGGALEIPTGIKAEAIGSMRVDYDTSSNSMTPPLNAIPGAAMLLLDRWR